MTSTIRESITRTRDAITIFSTPLRVDLASKHKTHLLHSTTMAIIIRFNKRNKRKASCVMFSVLFLSFQAIFYHPQELQNFFEYVIAETTESVRTSAKRFHLASSKETSKKSTSRSSTGRLLTPDVDDAVAKSKDTSIAERIAIGLKKPAPIAASSNTATTGSVRFVPFPHNRLGYGMDAACDWKALALNDPLAQSLLGQNSLTPPDAIQRAALKHSICVPRNETLRSRLHLFSTKEAKQCLANVTLMIAGDSYNKQLFIGLADILIGDPTNKKILGSQRRTKIVNQRQEVRVKQCYPKRLTWLKVTLNQCLFSF